MMTPTKSLIHARSLWDCESVRWGKMPEVTLGDHPFMQLLDAYNVFDREARVLDVGCGSGRFTVALARKCKEAVGIDLSEAMISQARERAQKAAIHNIRFICEPWQRANLETLGFRKSFDTVFAHMTDAVNDAQTAKKMTEASRSLCILEMWQLRRNAALEAAFGIVGWNRALDHRESLRKIEEYLKESQIPYEKRLRTEKKIFKRTLDEVLTFCTWRVPEEYLTEDIIKQMAESLKFFEKNNIIEVETEEDILTLIWRVNDAH